MLGTGKKMLLGLSESLPTLVEKRFTAAKDSGNLIFSSSQRTTILASGIVYQLRYCPSLVRKPGVKPKEHRDPKPDPFENPSPDLLVAEIPRAQPNHILVLNKFPIIHNHFILATKAIKAQTDLLEKDDLAATFACLKSWGEGQDGGATAPRRLFAFFNSGEHSGASQPHRHLQFIPVEDMRDQDSNSDPWTPLIDHLSTRQAMTTGSGYKQLPNLPFVHFALPIPSGPSAETLHDIYLSLYRAALTAHATKLGADYDLDEEQRRTEGPSAFSYNLGMIDTTMIICPRGSEHASLSIDTSDTPDVADAGLVALNGTILAGTLMVKMEPEWNELRSKPDLLNTVLTTIGIPA